MRFPKEEGILPPNCNMKILPECLTFGFNTVTSYLNPGCLLPIRKKSLNLSLVLYLYLYLPLALFL